MQSSVKCPLNVPHFPLPMTFSNSQGIPSVADSSGRNILGLIECTENLRRQFTKRRREFLR